MQSDTAAEPDKSPTAQPAEPTTETGTELKMTAEQKLLVEGWEQSHGRKMTNQEIRFGIELWNSTVSEL